MENQILKSLVPYISPEWLRTVFTEPLYNFQYLNPKKEILLEGNHSKRVLVIASLDSGTILSPTEEILLWKILKSVNLELDHITLLKAGPDFPFGLFRILKIWNPEKALIFAKDSELKISSNLRKYTIMNKGLSQILWSDCLTDLEADPQKNLKNQLWIQLKILFG